MENKREQFENIFLIIIPTIIIIVLGIWCISTCYIYSMGEGDKLIYTTFDNEVHTIVTIEQREPNEYCNGYTCYDNTYIVTVDNGEIFGTDIGNLEVGVKYMMEMKVLHCETDDYKYIFRCYGVGD